MDEGAPGGIFIMTPMSENKRRIRKRRLILAFSGAVRDIGVSRSGRICTKNG